MCAPGTGSVFVLTSSRIGIHFAAVCSMAVLRNDGIESFCCCCCCYKMDAKDDGFRAAYRVNILVHRARGTLPAHHSNNEGCMRAHVQTQCFLVIFFFLSERVVEHFFCVRACKQELHIELHSILLILSGECNVCPFVGQFCSKKQSWRVPYRMNRLLKPLN